MKFMANIWVQTTPDCASLFFLAQEAQTSILGGLYLIYLGVLFLLSFFFPDATYVRSFLRYVCQECTGGAQGRRSERKLVGRQAG